MRHDLPLRILPALAALLPIATAADEVACHVTYGGETQIVAARPVASPYGVPTLQVVYEPVRDGELQYWCELRP